MTDEMNDEHGPNVPRSTFLRWTGLTFGAIAAGAGGALGDLTGPLRVWAAGNPATRVVSTTGLWLGNIKGLPRNQSLSYKDPKTGDPAVLIRLASGGVVAFDAVCTHAGCTVPYDPARKLLVCPCHGARYDPTRGAAVVGGPAPQPLTRLPIRVDASNNVYALNAKPAAGKPVSRLHPPSPVTQGDDGGSDDGTTTSHGKKHDN